MNETFKKKFAQSSEKFDKWDSIFQSFSYSNFQPDKVNDEKYVEISFQLQRVLSEILEIFISFGKFRDSWELPPKMDIFPFGQAAIVKSKKLRHDFSFGLYEDEFFIETSILYPRHLKHMSDDFWILFTELAAVGTFAFQECACPFDENVPLQEAFKGGRSNVYKIIRNYILLEQYPEGSLDLGLFKITWPQKTQWDILIKKGCEAFKRMYELNYMLYRQEYLRMKAKGLSPTQ